MKQATIMVKQDDGSFKEVGISLRPNSTLSADKNGELQSGQGQAAIPQGDHSHAEGQNTLATGIAAHAEGGGPDNGAGSSSGSGGGILDGTFDVSGCTEGFVAGGATMNGTYTKGAPDGGSGGNPVWSNGVGGFIYNDGMTWHLECGFGTPGMLTMYGTVPGSDPNVVPSDGWTCMGPSPAFALVSAGASGSGSSSSGSGLGGLASGNYSHARNKENEAAGEASSASGYQALARQFGEHAFAGGMFSDRGDAQVSHFVLKGEAYAVQKLADGSEIQIPAGYGFYLDALCISGDASPYVAGGHMRACGHFIDNMAYGLTVNDGFETFSPSLSDAGVLTIPALNHRAVTYAMLMLMKLTV